MAKNPRYRYVDDYETVPYVGANGRSKEKVRYIGSYYWYAGEKKAVQKTLVLLHVLAYVTAILTIAPLFFRHSAFLTLYVAVIHVVSLFPALYLLMGSFRLPWQQKAQRRDEFDKGFRRIRRSAMAIFVILGLTLVGETVFWCLNRVPFTGLDGLFLGCLVLSMASCYLIYKVEKGISVEQKPNDFVTQKIF